MPGFLLHVGATVLCAHGGQAQPTVPNPRVTGQRPADGDDDRAVRRRRLRAAAAARRQRAVRDRAVDHRGATRVTSNGQPLLLLDSQAICAPTGTPLLIVGRPRRA